MIDGYEELEKEKGSSRMEKLKGGTESGKGRRNNAKVERIVVNKMTGKDRKLKPEEENEEK